MEDILNWLSVAHNEEVTPEHYQAGMELVNEHSHNAVLKRTFAAGYNEFRAQLMAVELRNIAEFIDLSEKTTQVVKEEIFTQPHTERKIARIDFALLPEAVKVLAVKKGKLFADAGRAHYTLLQNNFGKDPDKLTPEEIAANAELAQTIVENLDENQQIWDEIDSTLTTGQPIGKHPDLVEKPVEKRVADLDDVSLIKFLRNRPTDIAKYENTRIPAAKDEKSREKLLAKVAEWKEQLEQAKEAAKRRGI